jgi:hypothetical protein
MPLVSHVWTSQGLPSREMLQTLYKLNRDRTVLEALTFLLWCVVFIGLAIAVNDVHLVYSSNASLFNQLLDEEFPGCVAVQHSGTVPFFLSC